MIDRTTQRFFSGAVLGGLLLAPGAILAAARVMAGQWEYTMTTQTTHTKSRLGACP